MTCDDNHWLLRDNVDSEDVVYKPWGYYIDIHRTNEVVFKQIVIHVGEELSYQSHEKRDEFWFIKSGVGLLIMNGIDIRVSADESLQIHKNNKHMIKNIGDRDLEIFEMQCGTCDENDIIRYSDKYGRD